jgi:hypothetical protein
MAIVDIQQAERDESSAMELVALLIKVPVFPSSGLTQRCAGLVAAKLCANEQSSTETETETERCPIRLKLNIPEPVSAGAGCCFHPRNVKRVSSLSLSLSLSVIERKLFA